MKIPASDFAKRLGIDDFSETVLAKALTRCPAISEGGPWIAGGAVRNTIAGNPLDSDWDFFFANEQQAKDFEDELSGNLVKQTDKASTFMLPAKIPEGMEGEGVVLPQMDIQAIKFQFYPSADAVIESFDYTISQFSFDGTDIYVSPFALWDLARKRLVPTKITFAAASVRRMLKYAKQGYTLCPGAITDVLQQVVNDPRIIEADTQYID